MSYKDIIVQNPATRSSNIDSMSFLEFLDKDPKVKKIPNYQRPYSWEPEQVEVLFKDLHKIIITEGKDWFFGPLFTTQNKVEKNISELEILDGQQRITTIILILRVLYVSEFATEDSWIWNDEVSESEKNDYKKVFNLYREQIKSCLITTEVENGKIKYSSNFLTDLSSREVFSEWLEGIMEIEDFKSYDRFKHLRNPKSSKFALTKERINVNLNFIYGRIEQMVKEVNGLIQINQLINCILNRLYIINVPLYKSSSVLEIFETLNNRGKPLNLTDLLRFRTMVDAKNDKDKTDIELIWHQIFELHQNLEKVDLFKGGINDYFEKYINSISVKSGGYTKDQERLDRFVEFYKQENGSLSELKKVRDVLQIFNWLFTSQKDGSNKFANLFKGEQKIRATAILKVLHYALLASETALISICSYLRNKMDIDTIEGPSGDSARKVSLGFFFEFTKTIISLDIYQRKPSNERRNIYIGYARAFLDSEGAAPINIYKNLKPHEKLDAFKHAFFQNLIKIKHDNRNEKYNLLILHFVQILVSCKNFSFPSELIKNDDHLVPQKWYRKKEWIDTITKSSLIEAIDSIKNEKYKESFNELMKEELWNEKSSQDSFIQLIGNKWYIHNQENMKASDLPWRNYVDKKGIEREGRRTIYLEYKKTPNANFFIPTIEDPSLEENFGTSEIINRTCVFFDLIVENVDCAWNNLSVK